MSAPQPPIQIEADLLVDTGSGSRRAGLRQGGGSPRQLLFRAGDLYVDLSLHRRSGSTELALMGQLMAGGAASRNLADLPVTVGGRGGDAAHTRSNGLGEFLLTGIPARDATLGISLDRWTSLQIPLPAVALPGDDR